ncbi:hypothetical protein I8J29_04495 [Paenibacillus sp. MWE-103]|uniref:Uncharacterized protein n=1 Tax=Paenibacillus artemisiicola TaxID=1172618 RepID=A0ABS3W5I5_9BACL|nr:hypothetical protein [Paenibacillus artemisiicola]MBO7743441.1 hypothetical protein [Paenibacillus artemisiicola]
MNNFRSEYRTRYYQAHMTVMGTIQLHQRNPHVVALWSVAFPGFGHFLVHRFFTGFALFFWEFYINQVTHLNTAMMYSFNGQFDRAKAILDEKHIYLYIPVYLFAIWDSYRTAVDENKIHVLAKRENAKFSTISITPFGCEYLSKKDPWIAFAWAMAFPSLGQLYIHRIVNAMLTLVTTIVVILNSNLVEGVHYCLLFNFSKARDVIDQQWTLYFPSIYFYGIYDAYSNAVELSKLYNREQADFLKEHHQSEHFVLYKGEKIE